ncbi:MAG TPA: TIGR02680 family protein, partial [Kineosporiaceae bacterium]
GPAAAGAGPAAAGAGPAAAGAGTSGGVAGAGTGAGETLSSVLVPEPDGPVPAHVVSALLERVALDTTLPPRGDVAIGADGSWRMAALTGSYGKPEACYIGATARRRARDRRIEQLRADLSLVQAALDELTDAWDEVTGRQRQLQAEAGRLPGHDAVDAARHRADKQAARVEAAQESLTAAAAGVAEAEGHAADMLRALAELCAGHGLPTDPGALDAVARAVGELVAAADRWLHAHATAHREREVAAMHEGAAGEARAAARDACDQAAQARDVAVELAARLEAVELAVGTGYEQVLEHLAAARGEQESLRDRLARLGDTLVRLSTRKGALDTARTRDAAERDAAVAERDAVGQHVRALAAGFLPKDAGLVLAPGAADGVKATLELARAVAARWASLPHEPRHVAEAQSRLMETLHTTRDVLTRHADAELVDDGQVRVLSASVGGLRVGAAGLLEAVTAERDSSRDDITASEHDLFDTTLTGDTRRHLAARIRQAGALVDAMNARLDLVRTASDVAVRLTWQVDPALPPSTRTARELLLKDPVHLSEQDRAALHAFFRERIETARAANTATSWEQQLTEVFDYTAWHQFVVKVDRSRGAGWEVLTRKLHGALSGGEKAIALHLPLFAAIAAHYEAVPEAPRLILLDEVFVGVDAANRGQVFALLSALDLDLVLTSDHEWCTYAELDGIAVHQLVAGDGDGDAAVTSVRFTWDGRSLHADADTDTGAAQAAP